MTIWYYEPPQGFSSEQGLSIIGRPIRLNFSPPQGLGGGGGDTGPTDMLYESGIEMAYESGIIMEYEGVTT